jgi:acyl dehydratase
MSLDQSFVGRSWPPTEPYQVGREKIREFARAIGATEPEHHDPEAARALGYADVVAPPTFPIVISLESSRRQIIDDPGLGMDFGRVLHAEQKFAYTRPVVAGDTLVCVNSVETITTRAGQDFLTTRTEVTDEAGDPIVTVWSKLVQKADEQGADEQ